MDVPKRLPEQDSSTGRALKTAVQAAIGFIVGLFVVVWAVPGVPDAVAAYAKDNLVPVALAFGIPSGIASFVWNYLRRDVENY